MKLKQIASAVFALGALAASGLAHADLYPDFKVNTSTYTTTPLTFTADKITGNYVELITFTPTTFTLQLKFEAGQFLSDDGTNYLKSGTTGLGSQYGLYALFNGAGTLGTGPGGTTTFTLNPAASTFNFFIDPKNDTTLATPTGTLTGASTFAVSGNSDDVKLATGVGKSGSGTLSCSTGNNCGSFGQTTSFNLVNPSPAQGPFFTAPNPFYSISMQSGQFNGFAPTAGTTLALNGSMDVIFATVPEPSSLALVGAAFIGIGAISRRKKA